MTSSAKKKRIDYTTQDTVSESYLDGVVPNRAFGGGGTRLLSNGRAGSHALNADKAANQDFTCKRSTVQTKRETKQMALTFDLPTNVREVAQRAVGEHKVAEDRVSIGE